MTNEGAADKEQREAKLVALRAAIDEGDCSGIAEGDVFERVRKTLDLAPKRRPSISPLSVVSEWRRFVSLVEPNLPTFDGN